MPSVVWILIFGLGMLAFVFGIKEVSNNSLKHNVLDIMFSLLTFSFELSGIGSTLIGIVLMIISIMGFMFGWGK